MERTGISISEILSSLWKYKGMCALICVLSIALCVGYNRFLTPTLYESELRLSLSAVSADGQEDYAYPQRAAATYVNLFEGNVFLDEVIARSGVGGDADKLEKRLRIQTIGGTGLIDLRVKADSPQQSLLLAQTISQLAQEKISGELNAEVFHYPQEGKRVTPGIPLSLAVGGAAGILFSIFASSVRLSKHKKTTLQTP